MPNAQIAVIPGSRNSPPMGAQLCLKAGTMLLVEDSRFAAEAVRLLCRRVGVRLRRAGSLDDARAHLRVYRPDIVLVDIGLPDGSGLSLIKDLAKSARRPERIIATSGDAGLEQPALDAGATEFLLKPVSLGRHLAQIIGIEEDDVDTLKPSEDMLTILRSRTEARAAGADPLALNDDLRMARDLLNGARSTSPIAYVGQFLCSLARTANRADLIDPIQQGAKFGNRSALLYAIDQLAPSPPVV